DLEIRRVRPARAQPPVSLPEARHALPRPGRGALRHDRPGNGEGRGLGDAPRERATVSQEAPALFLADVADLRAHRPLRVGDAALGGAGAAGHGAPHLADRATPLRGARGPPGRAPDRESPRPKSSRASQAAWN